jgi:hypothetical protein
MIDDCHRGHFMDDVSAGSGAVRLFFHNDDDTPENFIRQLLQAVFGQPEGRSLVHRADRAARKGRLRPLSAVRSQRAA